MHSLRVTICSEPKTACVVVTLSGAGHTITLEDGGLLTPHIYIGLGTLLACPQAAPASDGDAAPLPANEISLPVPPSSYAKDGEEADTAIGGLGYC